jgi:hypothetical protein
MLGVSILSLFQRLFVWNLELFRQCSYLIYFIILFLLWGFFFCLFVWFLYLFLFFILFIYFRPIFIGKYLFQLFQTAIVNRYFLQDHVVDKPDSTKGQKALALRNRFVSNLVCTRCFWSNLHHVRSRSEDWKAK